MDIAGQARFAGFTQAFGIDTNIANGTIDGAWALDVNNSGYNVTGQTELSLGSGEFAWVRGNQASSDAFGCNLQSSQNSESGPTDRMISYLIQDDDYNGGRPSYLLFIEDNGAGPDNDYNDLVIEISVIPLPAAAGRCRPLPSWASSVSPAPASRVVASAPTDRRSTRII